MEKDEHTPLGEHIASRRHPNIDVSATLKRVMRQTNPFATGQTSGGAPEPQSDEVRLHLCGKVSRAEPLTRRQRA
jgi:hypothetical protein